MPLKAFFKNGVLSEPVDSVTAGFVQALTLGLIRYMGNSRTTTSGMERPLSAMLSYDEASAEVEQFFEDALETLGVEHADVGRLSRNALKIAFFDLNFDLGILIRTKNDLVNIEIFERGDDIGGLEASLPGGVNFEGKVKSVNYALPIPQIAVNHIEHSLNTAVGFDAKPAEFHQDLSNIALEAYKKHQNLK